ncbi:MAG TPA: hypothetical protein VH158_06880 [Gemmatimonadales bacterium]|jgi:hypothetical protein|nr:hypothetical protein [Gemmatimonadales bacterium]
MRCLAVLLCVAATSLRAQQPPPPPPPDSARPESTRTPPPPPTREQQRFLDGLRTASRGIAQLKVGLGRVARAQTTADTASQHKAGRYLAGLCGSARPFMKRGRPHMLPTVYTDSIELMARRLVKQLDSLIAYTPSCEQDAAAAPVPIATELGKRLKSYDAAWRDFRVAIGLPVKDDTTKASRRP